MNYEFHIAEDPKAPEPLDSLTIHIPPSQKHLFATAGEGATVKLHVRGLMRFEVSGDKTFQTMLQTAEIAHEHLNHEIERLADELKMPLGKLSERIASKYQTEPNPLAYRGLPIEQKKETLDWLIRVAEARKEKTT